MMWPLSDSNDRRRGSKPRGNKRGAGADTTTLTSLLPLPQQGASWLRRPQQERWIDREDVRTNTQYAGGALVGAWLLRALARRIGGGGGSAQRQRRRQQQRQQHQHQPGLLTALLGAGLGAAAVYRARGGDLNARARELSAAAQRRLAEAEHAARQHARRAEQSVRRALEEAQATAEDLAPALREEAARGREALERSSASFERAMREAGEEVEAEVQAAAERLQRQQGRRSRRDGI